jgi:hypothetical protein
MKYYDSPIKGEESYTGLCGSLCFYEIDTSSNEQ